jgi:hypothetical protein
MQTTLYSARVTASGKLAHGAGVIPKRARVDICIIDFHAAKYCTGAVYRQMMER